MTERTANPDLEKAETLALEALKFLAEDVQRFGGFLAATGIGPAALRAEAASPRVLAAVLDHLMQDEPLLLTFSANAGILAAAIPEAARLLACQAAAETRS